MGSETQGCHFFMRSYHYYYDYEMKPSCKDLKVYDKIPNFGLYSLLRETVLLHDVLKTFLGLIQVAIAIHDQLSRLC